MSEWTIERIREEVRKANLDMETKSVVTLADFIEVLAIANVAVSGQMPIELLIEAHNKLNLLAQKYEIPIDPEGVKP